MSFKKLALVLTLISSGLCTMSAQSLDRLSVRAGMELLVPSGARDYFNNGAGVAGGVSYKLPLKNKFFFEPGIYGFYHTASGKESIFLDNHFYQGTASVGGLRLPFNFGYDFNVMDNLALSFTTGPWLNINMSARQNVTPNMSAPTPVPISSINLFKYGFKHVDGMWGISLKMTFAQHYTIGVNGGIAFTPLASFGVKDKKVKLYGNTVAVYLGYNF